MVWEELSRWGPGFAASLMPGAVVPQLLCFLVPDRKDLIDEFVRPYCEDTTGRRITAWCSSEPEVGSDGSNYEDPRVHHHNSARLYDDMLSLDANAVKRLDDATLKELGLEREVKRWP